MKSFAFVALAHEQFWQSLSQILMRLDEEYGELNGQISAMSVSENVSAFGVVDNQAIVSFMQELENSENGRLKRKKTTNRLLKFTHLFEGQCSCYTH